MKSAGRLIVFVFAILTLAASAYAADGSSLIKAVEMGDKAEVEALLAKGTDVNGKDIYGQTALHKAAYLGKKDIAELLLDKGADVNAKDKDGSTPLHRATFYGHKDIAELLLAKGANINAKTERGITPLHVAAVWGKKDIAELLLAKGADITAKNSDGRTPLDSAVREGQKEIIELLNAHLVKQAILLEERIKIDPRAAFIDLTTHLKGNPADDNTRRLIIKLASELNPQPAITEEVERHMARGSVGVKTATKPADFKEAAVEFDQAALAAPWYGDAYYNAGIAYSKAGDHATAIGKFKLYLLTSPSAADQKDAKAKIFEEEFLIEKAAKSDSRVMGRWTRMEGGGIFYLSQKRYEDWIIMPTGADGFEMYRSHSGEKELAPADQRHMIFSFAVNGDVLEGSSSWDGTWGYGRLCDPITSRFSGTMSGDGQRLRVKFQMRYQERGCELIDVMWDFERLGRIEGED